MAKFDSKSFNERAFGKYVDVVPKLKKNELVKSKALQANSQIKQAFSGQTGVVYATIPMYGRIDGTPLNYDGKTDITATSTTSYERGVIVIGRAKAWVENDFAEDVTGGAGFMSNVARQVAEYWDEIDQDTLLAIIEGIFSMTGAANLKFVDGHTYNISEAVNGLVQGSTLNTAIQKASGDKKKKFTISIMHSAIATNLENLKLLAYMTYTDANGIERQLELATWNGRAVIIDDGMPTAEVAEHYIKCASTDVGALKVVADDATPGVGEVKITTTGITVVAGEYVLYLEAFTQYTTYVLGNGAFDYEDIGAEVPYAMVRDEKTSGGQTLLYSRQRKVFAPYGISFTKAAMVTNSPTDAELKTASNWELVHDGAATGKKYFDHKAIPIARIISRG
ncbi:MAG: phage coat protein [Candidatus Cloacimonetes bacterium]|nr:phage coat protein [Candidatus Cloacimonadota bacterium]